MIATVQHPVLHVHVYTGARKQHYVFKPARVCSGEGEAGSSSKYNRQNSKEGTYVHTCTLYIRMYVHTCTLYIRMYVHTCTLYIRMYVHAHCTYVHAHT